VVATGNPFITIRNTWQGEYAPVDFNQVVHAFYCNAINNPKKARDAKIISPLSKEQAIPTPPPGEVATPDHDGPLPVDAQFCGYAYQLRDMQPGGFFGQLTSGSARYFDFGFNSVQIINGCTCAIWG
jgi:hypothetical protein